MSKPTLKVGSNRSFEFRKNCGSTPLFPLVMAIQAVPVPVVAALALPVVVISPVASIPVVVAMSVAMVVMSQTVLRIASLPSINRQQLRPCEKVVSPQRRLPIPMVKPFVAPEPVRHLPGSTHVRAIRASRIVSILIVTMRIRLRRSRQSQAAEKDEHGNLFVHDDLRFGYLQAQNRTERMNGGLTQVIVFVQEPLKFLNPK